ncbi:hypothetical protein BCR44DRAFT_1501249 [Catenaria anguillulae PL171]|uniref:Uncharacterized protein n=1 Tax=Catenaria anguillulae PL171 TaxID=765915 RepID=A0A1Y2HFJ0_9FUNG|nr:hypothetical protein BCR44DRAFT_1501249 [Catenaria anguillulae PL171]
MVMPWIDTDTASRTGNSWLLDTLWNMAASPVMWWHDHGLPVLGNRRVGRVRYKRAGHVHVLERWRTNVGLHAFDFEGERALRCEAIDLACKHGRLEVVKWWFDKFPQDQWVASQQAVAYAILAKHTMSLTDDTSETSWRRCRYSSQSIAFELPFACYNGNFELIQSVLAPGDSLHAKHRPLEYWSHAFDEPSAAGNLPVLQWWSQTRFCPKSDTQAMETLHGAASNSHTAVLKLWRERSISRKGIKSMSGIVLQHASPSLQRRASTWFHRPAVATWSTLRNRAISELLGLPAEEVSLDAASERGQVAVLEWIMTRSGLKYTYTKRALDRATANGHLDVLGWRRDSGLELKMDTLSLDICVQYLSMAWGSTLVPVVKRWWNASGLVSRKFK